MPDLSLPWPLEASLAPPAAMQAAEQAAFAAGADPLAMMERAGQAVADHLATLVPAGPVAVWCGPGNNGGDGYVVARVLAARGWPVTVLRMGDDAPRSARAQAMAARWQQATGAEPVILPAAQDGGGAAAAAAGGAVLDAARGAVVVDALYGIGLDRPVARPVVAVMEALRRHAAQIVAVDIASGVCGQTGQVLGGALAADHTITFHAAKPGHVLHPGAGLSGRLHVVDIGLDPVAWMARRIPVGRTLPVVWRHLLPAHRATHHKFSRGVVLAAGSGTMPGAALLSCLAARRIGAGMVSLMLPEAIAPHAALAQPGLVVRGVRRPEEIRELLGDPRLNAVILGPGLSQGRSAQTLLDHVLEFSGARVLDADALSLLSQHTAMSFAGTQTVLTPHEGEFRRLFPDLAEAPDKITRAQAAARRVAAVVVLKGADTVIAAPDGRALVNSHARPSLATAGSGDVLAGMIAGLAAQGMEAFAAAAAAVWLHGDAAMRAPPGLIAEDLPALAATALAALSQGAAGAAGAERAAGDDCAERAAGADRAGDVGG